MAPKKKSELTRLIRQELGGGLTQEVRDLIDAAVRQQWDSQQITQRLVNTHYFRQKFPGLIEKNGSIANLLSGQEGTHVSPQNLASAISHYNTALETYGSLSKQYGYHFNKDAMKAIIKGDQSPDEFKARLTAIDTIDSNPAAEAAFNEQLKMQGIKAGKDAAYRAALGAGPNKFTDIYEATQYQTQLGLGSKEAASLAQGGPHGATIQTTDQIVQAARQNLQAIMPELSAQGISAASLVKALSNPTAFPKEMEAIQQSLATRQGLFGRPQPGMYPQQGQGGGIALYNPDKTAAYG